MKKKIVNYCNECYAIMLPVYYEFEEKPAWRIVFIGSEKKCRENYELYPDFIFATYEENLKNRKNKKAEYLHLLAINKRKEAEKIKKTYNF